MAKTPVVLGYYPEWRTQIMPPDRLDFRLYSHVTYSFASLTPEGAWTFPSEKNARVLCQSAHKAGTKTILAIGGASSNASLSKAMIDPARRMRLIDEIVKWAQDKGFDGLDVDWESPENATERDYMNATVKEIRERWSKAVLTMAAPASNWSGKWYETAALLPYLDLMNVMNYDFYGPWSDKAGYNAALYAASDADKPLTGSGSTDYWLKTKRWPAEKLVFGIPLYGRGFKAAKIGDPAKGSYERSYVGYPTIPQLVKAGWKKGWDDTAKVPYLSSPDSKEVISYDNDASIKLKAAYARKQGTAGVFFWDIVEDWDGKTNPLVRAARTGFGLRSG